MRRANNGPDTCAPQKLLRYPTESSEENSAENSLAFRAARRTSYKFLHHLQVTEDPNWAPASQKSQAFTERILLVWITGCRQTKSHLQNIRDENISEVE